MPASAAVKKRLRLVAALAGLAIAAAGVPGWFTGQATAATSAGDGSGWGAAGLTGSASSRTVSWSNADNAADSVVPRDGRQQLPHTDHKTYDDVSSAVVSSYFSAFGPDNGFGGLKVKVSQTQELVNQAVTLDISGVAGGAPYGVTSPVYLQVFQCWGGLKSNGSPDPASAEPDPATCQMGAGDAAVRGGSFAPAFTRYIKTDPLAIGGDWDRYFDAPTDVPFTAITGQKSGSTIDSDNEFFNGASTNEISKVPVSAAGTATRQFEMQTSLESNGLGCGVRRGQTSTKSCWLVVVPRIDGVLSGNGPISPSVWAQRLQMKVGFRDIVAGCPSGQDRTLTIGSELLSTAAASWTPGLCDAKNIALGYTQIGDPVARAQFASGAAEAVLTTQPSDAPAVYAPVALTAPVIAYTLSYQTDCPPQTDPYTDEKARSCGYDNAAELDADNLRSGTLIRNMRLDARLVAKLLTQSYSLSIFDQEGFRRSGWMVDRPNSLAQDPEFRRLNPDLAHISLTASAVTNLDHLVLAALRSDAASAIWTWILGDSDGAAFLNGCPDADGMTINPFYSTRTYEGCETDSNTLAAAADAARRATATPSSYVDLALTYPPDGSPFPLPGWQEADAAGTPPYGVLDFLPRVDSMPVAGRDVAIGYLPRNSSLCLTTLDFSCVPKPGLWKDPKIRQTGDHLGVMAVTTAATAARFQLPTAELCNTAGTKCVGANTSSLQKAAGEFTDSGTDGVQQPGPANYAAGAYPLTMPVYAGISKSLSASSRATYAKALSYVTTTGQKPGFAIGNLPPGYAPLTKAMRSQAAAAIAALTKKTPTTKPSGSATDGGEGSGSTDTGSTPGDVASPPGALAEAPSTVDLPPGTVLVSANTQAWPRLLLPLGLGIALLAGLAGPLLRLRGTIRIG
jgi:hypothetical protein